MGRKSERYWLSVEKKHYRRSFEGPYLLCIHLDAMDALLYELHEGVYRSYTRGHSSAHRGMTQGYWWPNMQRSSQEYVKKFDQGQRYALDIHQLEEVLNPLTSPWPFFSVRARYCGVIPKGHRR